MLWGLDSPVYRITQLSDTPGIGKDDSLLREANTTRVLGGDILVDGREAVEAERFFIAYEYVLARVLPH